MVKRCLNPIKSYNKYIDSLKSTLPPHMRCHRTLHENDISYCCKNCCKGESSCMCSSCFDLKKHEVILSVFTHLQGHKYVCNRTSGTGCCDCGDPESWDRDHWCDKHRNVKEVPDCDQLLPEE